VADWYRPHETERAHALYDNVRAWGGDRRDVTVIGGVAVHELVRPAVRMRSRDLDLVLHSNAALASFEGQFARWGIAWRRHGRNTFKECRFVDAEAFPPVIDVFTTDAEVGAARFGLHKGRNVLAEVQGQGFLPTLPKLLQLKVRAVEARQGALCSRTSSSCRRWPSTPTCLGGTERRRPRTSAPPAGSGPCSRDNTRHSSVGSSTPEPPVMVYGSPSSAPAAYYVISSAPGRSAWRPDFGGIFCAFLPEKSAAESRGSCFAPCRRCRRHEVMFFCCFLPLVWHAFSWSAVPICLKVSWHWAARWPKSDAVKASGSLSTRSVGTGSALERDMRMGSSRKARGLACSHSMS
jgi:hypothetical protein